MAREQDRKPGRPRSGGVRVTVSLPAKHLIVLDMMAKDMGVSRSEIVRRIMADRLKEDGERR